MQSPAQPLSPQAQVLEESLAAALAEPERALVLEDALDIAGLTEIPSRPTALRVFVDGALFSALARRLSVESALELVQQVRRTLQLAMAEDAPRSDIRLRPRVLPKTVIVASQASLVLYLLQDVVGDRAEVISALRVDELQELIQKRGDAPLLVIVDRRHPCVGANPADACVGLSAESTVVWWACTPQEENAARAKLTAVRLITRDFDARLSDLGELCVRVLDGQADG